MASKQKEKEAILKKFKTRSEKQTIKNEGELVIIGNMDVNLKQLIWDDANKLEDCIVSQLSKIQSLSDMNLQTINIEEVLNIIVHGFLREALLELTEILTEGEITYEVIKECRATKDDVIELVVKGITLNYSYLKNLIALVQRLK